MITQEKAEAIAMSHLIQMEQTGSVELKIAQVREESFGWVFFYQSKDYLEKGSLSSMLAGNAPFAVLRESGELRTFGTAHPSDFYIDQLKKECE